METCTMCELPGTHANALGCIRALKEQIDGLRAEIRELDEAELVGFGKGAASRWVSVEEQLPDADATVLVWIPGQFDGLQATGLCDVLVGRTEEGSVWFAYIDYNERWLTGDDATPISPTHWMPLPEPPSVREVAQAVSV